jgi:hypothetical protein
VDLPEALRGDFRAQTRRMGVGVTEFLRGRMRPRWLRLTPTPDPVEREPRDAHAR